MRKLKFRAYDYKSKKMDYRPLIVCDYESGSYTGRRDLLSDSLSVIMQFTGLKDIKSNEIYEGDILAQYYPPEGVLPPQLEWIGVVDFDNYWESDVPRSDERYGKIVLYCSGYCLKTTNKPFKDVYGNKTNAILSLAKQHGSEVIGNIYENPELLEEKV